MGFQRKTRSPDTKPLAAQDALVYAVRLLSQRALTETELARKLRGRGANEALVTATLERLRESRFISDEHVAERTAQDEKLGSRGIRQKLMQRGVENVLIDQALQARDPKADLEQARALVERYGPKWAGPRAYAKGFAFLARRGYPSGVVRQALEDLKQFVASDVEADDVWDED